MKGYYLSFFDLEGVGLINSGIRGKLRTFPVYLNTILSRKDKTMSTTIYSIQKSHYIYLLIDENHKKYGGVRSCEGIPEKDPYMGSSKLVNEAMSAGVSFTKHIIKTFDIRDEANVYESDWLVRVKAAQSDDWYNMKNTYSNWHALGCTHSVEQNKKKSIRMQGMKRSEETRKKISKAKIGSKASRSTKDKMSKTRKGKPSPTKGMKGLTAGSINGQYGKHWYNNGNEDASFLPEDCPSGWIRGRIRGVLKGKDNPFYGKRHTQETKDKISKDKIGKNCGKDNPFYGKKHTQETKDMMRGSRK